MQRIHEVMSTKSSKIAIHKKNYTLENLALCSILIHVPITSSHPSLYTYTHTHTHTDDDNGFEFYPDHLRYDCVASIPQHLLNDILECFDKVKEYCMWCFYKRRKMGVVTLDPASKRMICSICMCKWESVLVIPASDYCWNFGEFEQIPIAPRPRDKPSMGPYEYCAKDDHFR